MEPIGLSALIAVYAREDPAFLDQALESLALQTRPADEVVLVEDGPLGGDLDAVVAAHARRLPLTRVALPANVGLGAALRIGVECCRGELVARMDSDDICVADRFDRQVRALRGDRAAAVAGGAIAEFIAAPGVTVAFRRPPAASAEIARRAKSRNPLNHMTVMFRREAVLAAGNYRPFRGFEDYHLWVRMLMAGSRFINLPEVLVHVRAGEGMLDRRRGLRYAGTELAFQKFLCDEGFISPLRGFCNALLRVPVRLAPPALGRFVYRRLLRSR
jgi:glycosyltransferase involved in cell wall biosynthesis